MPGPFWRNPLLGNAMLPVEVVLGPAWWHRQAGITFDEDFFFHPAKRVEVERTMERVLRERFGRFGLGENHDRDLPVVGAVHLAAGYLVSAMLGCRIEYQQNAPPQVIPAGIDTLEISAEATLSSPAYRKFTGLCEALKTKYGYLCGDVNFSGILNVALDLRGQQLFLDMSDRPAAVQRFLAGIAAVVDRFTAEVARATGTTSISVNRNVRHLAGPVWLHSECSHTMISVRTYEEFLRGFDEQWSRRLRPFGIHYCGSDPQRYAATWARLPHLDFLDVGWPGDVAELRRHLPQTFLNLRYSPVEIARQTPEEIRSTVRRLVEASGNPWLTGVCCVNMDDQVGDEQVAALFEEVQTLRQQYAAEEDAAGW